MKTSPKSALVVSILAMLAAPAPLLAEEVKTRVVTSQVYTVDRIYRSMTGPYSTVKVQLEPQSPATPGSTPVAPHRLWIRGYKAVMVGADGESPMPQEFMCHSNLDFDDVQSHCRRLGEAQMNPRIFTLSQGQLEIHFPEGYGIPVLSDESFNLTTQVLNLNDASGKPVQVRHKVTIEYVSEADVKEPMKPMFSSAAYGLAALEGANPYFGLSMPDPNKHGPGCLAAPNAGKGSYKDSGGRQFTGHWVVPPGRQENHTLVTQLMGLPYNTTIHYIAVHLHPFAESLELRDLTTHKSLFKSIAHNYPDKIGLEQVDCLSSDKGVQLYRDHQYEIVSIYNNSSGKPQDSMAVMYLYLLDKSYGKVAGGSP